MAATKRGAHLALSLERLDATRRRRAWRATAGPQRIGLSATQRPLEAHRAPSWAVPAARSRSWTPARARSSTSKSIVPVEDMARMGEALDARRGARRAGGRSGGAPLHLAVDPPEAAGADPRASVDPDLRELAAAGRAAGGAAQRAGRRGAGAGAPRQRRARAAPRDRGALKAGQPAGARGDHVSLELGIDMGAIDLVIQIEAPPSVASGLQRIGRAGHQVGEPSRGKIFPKYRGDLRRGGGRRASA